MRDSFDVTVFEGVYPPSEDTYLLIDAIAIEPNDFVLDAGCGAGLATIMASSIAGRVVSIDISIDAVKNTKENLWRNSLGLNTSLIQSDLLSVFSKDAKFSLILFNPPYLPADENPTDMDHALVGGIDGSELTERFIIDASTHLIKGGRLYIVVSSLTDIDSIVTTLGEYKFNIEQVKEEALFFERIQVVKGVWKGHKETVL